MAGKGAGATARNVRVAGRARRSTDSSTGWGRRPVDGRSGNTRRSTAASDGTSGNTRRSSARNTRSGSYAVANSARASVTPLNENRRKPRVAPKRTLSQRLELLKLRGVERLNSLKSVFGLLLRALLAAAVLAGVVSVVRLVERYVRTASSFAIVRIDVHGNQHLTRDAVAKAAGLELGQNVFEVGQDEVRRRLAEVPWIDSVRVRRRLPGSYSIEIRERRAVALLALDELYLVGDDGVAFKPLASDDPYDLPIITGLDPAQLKRDRRAAASAILSAVALLHDYQESGLSGREKVSEIHIESDGGLGLYVGSDATQVRLGRPPFREKLERLREVMSLLANQKTRAAYVLLDNPRRLDRVTVRLR